MSLIDEIREALFRSQSPVDFFNESELHASHHVVQPYPSNYVRPPEWGQGNRRNSAFTNSLQSTLSKIETHLPDNINYSSSIEAWLKSYSFPSKLAFDRYTIEENIPKGDVVNSSLDATIQFCSDLIDYSNLTSKNTKTQFVSGTTGVGKTTFLKLISKINKSNYLENRIVECRVKFANIQDLIRGEDITEAISILENHLIQELYSELIEDLVKVYDNKFTDRDLQELGDLLSEHILEAALLADSQLKIDFDDIVAIIPNRELSHPIFMGDQGKLNTDQFRLWQLFLLEVFKDHGYKFLIALDGFDAMNPEDVRLFQDKEQKVFLEIVKAVIRNNFSTNTREGRLLKKLNKTILISARPVTIDQLKVLEHETKTNLSLEKVVHVIGTDIYTLLKKRLDYLNSNIEQHVENSVRELFHDALVRGIRLISSFVYEYYDTVEQNRFINLFNHNVREKIYFIAIAMNLVIYLVTRKYIQGRDKGDIADGQLLDYKIFCAFIDEIEQQELKRRKSHSPLSSLESPPLLKFYEIEQALILNNKRVYRNFFNLNPGENKIDYEQTSNRGTFDNVFNYTQMSVYGASIDIPDSENYLPQKDPILGKYLILQYLLNRPESGVSVTIMKSSFSQLYKDFKVDNNALKVLIRAGYIIVSLHNMTEHVALSPKGKFCIGELARSLIYLEHVALNSVLPYSVQKLLKAPPVSDRRQWGRVSLINVLIFIRHLYVVYAQGIHAPETKKSKAELESFKNAIYFAKVDSSIAGMLREASAKDPDYEKVTREKLVKIGFLLDKVNA